MPAIRQSGFTLIELMVAVGVFILLTALAAPSLATYFDKARVRGAADDAINLVSEARQAAIKHDRTVELAITQDGDAWCLGANAATDPATKGAPLGAAVKCDCIESPDACVVDGQSMVVGSGEHEGVTLASPSTDMTLDGRLGIRIDGDIADADKSSFDLTSESKRYVLTVRVSPLGQATVCSKKGTILGYPSC